MKTKTKKSKKPIKGLRQLMRAVVNAVRELGFKGKNYDDCVDWFNRYMEKENRKREIRELLRGKVK